jgi:hypothetical protein
MSRRTLLSLALLSLAAFCFSSAALAQDNAYGKWVTDPNNLATPVFVYAPPPTGFNPLTASDVELDQYGFPPRPSRQEAGGYARWKRMVTATRVTPEVTPTLIYNELPRDWTVDSSAGNTKTGTSRNWSGFAYSVASGTFATNESMVCAEWTIPAVEQATGVCSSTLYQSSQWVGFDGAPSSGSSDILMAGTAANASCTIPRRTPITTATYSAWYEWYPNPEAQLSGLPVSPGDAMDVCVFYTIPSAASTQGHASIYNQTTNLGVAVGFNPSSGTTYVGDSAEWIMQRPTPTVAGGTLPDLPNFGFFGFNDAYAVDPSSPINYTPGAKIRGVTSEQITMACNPTSWSPSVACNRPTNISTFNLNVGRDGDTTMWFTADPPAQ